MSPIMANLIIKLAISRPKFEYKWDTAIKIYSTWGRSISGQTVPPWKYALIWEGKEISSNDRDK